MKKRKTTNLESVDIESLDIVFTDDFDAITASNKPMGNYNIDGKSDAATSHKVHERSTDRNVTYSKEFAVDSDMLLQLFKNTVEILSRIATLEKVILNGESRQNNSMVDLRLNDRAGKMDQFINKYNVFMKSKIQRFADDIATTSQKP